MGEHKLKEQMPALPAPAQNPPQPPPRYDPARVTEATAAGGLLELVLLLRRTTFMMFEDRVIQEPTPVASIAMAWPVAKQVRDLLTAQIEKHESDFGVIVELGKPEWQSKPS